MRVLLIEDDDNLRSTLVKRFEETGYVVDAADNGEDGLYKGQEYPADVAVIDLGFTQNFRHGGDSNTAPRWHRISDHRINCQRFLAR